MGTPNSLRQQSLRGRRSLAASPSGQDSLEVTPVNAHWLKVSWCLTDKLNRRAEAALGPDWHRVCPILRVSYAEKDDLGSHAREHHTDIVLPSDAAEWFLNLPQNLGEWIVELGYAVPQGKFFCLLRSAPTELPSRRELAEQSSDEPAPLEEHAMPNATADLHLVLRGEVSLFGNVSPGTLLSIDDQQCPVDSRSGQFQWRAPLPSGRYVVPLVACTERESQRVLVAIESNIHFLETEKRSR